MRSLISVVTVAGLLLTVGLLGAQQKKTDDPKSKKPDLDTKPKDSEVKKKLKEQEEKDKKEWEKRKKEMASRYVGGRPLREWIKDLESRDPSIQEAAMKTIASAYGVSAGEAIPKLMPLLKSADASTKVNACIAIGEINLADHQEGDVAQQVVAALIEKLNDTQSIVRFHAAMALGRVGTTTSIKNAIPKLVSMIGDRGSWEIRRAAAFALGMVPSDADTGPDARAINALISSLGDYCSQVRLQAILSLGTLGAPTRPMDRQNVDNAVRRAINDTKQNPVVQIWARVLWVQHFSKSKGPIKNEPKQFAAIARMLKPVYENTKNDLNARINAAQALGMLKAQAFIPELIEVIKTDDEEQAAMAAVSALASMYGDVTTNPKHILSIAGLLQASKWEFRMRGPQVLAMFGVNAKPALDDLIVALKEAEKTWAKEQKGKAKESETIVAREKQFIISIIDCLGAMDRAAAGAVTDLQRLAGHPDPEISFAAKAVLKFWQGRPVAAPAAPAAAAEKAASDR